MLGKGRDVLAMMADVVDKRLSARLQHAGDLADRLGPILSSRQIVDRRARHHDVERRIGKRQALACLMFRQGRWRAARRRAATSAG